MNSITYQLIIVKTPMSGGDYAKLHQLLKQIQGEKHAPNIFKVLATKSEVIIEYLEQEKLNYEIYNK